MGRRNDDVFIDWDELFNGMLHTVNLVAINFSGGINDFRALAYRQADRRKATVVTHKVNAYTVEIKATYVCICDSGGVKPHQTFCPFYTPPRTAEQEFNAQSAAMALAAGELELPPHPGP